MSIWASPYRVVANDIVCDDITVVTLDGDLDGGGMSASGCRCG